MIKSPFMIVHDFVQWLQALTVKVGRVKAYSAAETAGLKTCDYIWQINGKEVFEMSHNECVKEVKEATTMLSLNVERLAEFQEPELESESEEHSLVTV